MKFLKFIPLLFVFAALPLMVNAQGSDYGVAVGEAIPHDLTLKDSAGEIQSFESLKGENGLVVVFVRSVDWCPYCQAQLIDLGEKAQAITDLGYTLVSVSYDSVDKLAAFQKKYDFPYALLSDEGSEAIKAFGILNDQIQPGAEFYGIPHPGIFILSADGVVQEKIFEEGYKNRPPVDDIVTKIKVLSGR